MSCLEGTPFCGIEGKPKRKPHLWGFLLDHAWVVPVFVQCHESARWALVPEGLAFLGQSRQRKTRRTPPKVLGTIPEALSAVTRRPSKWLLSSPLNVRIWENGVHPQEVEFASNSEDFPGSGDEGTSMILTHHKNPRQNSPKGRCRRNRDPDA